MVAVKRFRDPYARSEIMAELQALNIPRHPNIIGINYANLDRGFIVYDLYRHSLQDRLREPRRWSPEEFVDFFHPLCRALQHAHKEHRYHRDIKPANIMIAQSGEPVLIDFGIAAIVEDSNELRATFAGTLLYMAPEVLGNGTYDLKADLYSLGVVFFEVLTGRLPFENPVTAAGLYLMQQNGQRPRLDELNSAVPAAICDITERLLSYEPDARPNASAIIAALKTVYGEYLTTLDDLQNGIEIIYSLVNQQRETSDLLCRLNARLTALTAGLETAYTPANRRRIEAAFVGAFAWLCNVFSRLNASFFATIEAKYPGVCPYCGECPCNCSDWTFERKVATNQSILERILGREERDAHRDGPGNSLSFYIDRFDSIYGARNQKASIGFLCLQMLKECGEAMDAVSRLEVSDRASALVVELELADVAAWYIALVNFYRRSHPEFNLTTMVRVHYAPRGQWQCPRCGQRSCQCPPRYATNFVNEWTLEQPDAVS